MPAEKKPSVQGTRKPTTARGRTPAPKTKAGKGLILRIPRNLKRRISEDSAPTDDDDMTLLNLHAQKENPAKQKDESESKTRRTTPVGDGRDAGSGDGEYHWVPGERSTRHSGLEVGPMLDDEDEFENHWDDFEDGNSDDGMLEKNREPCLESDSEDDRFNDTELPLSDIIWAAFPEGPAEYDFVHDHPQPEEPGPCKEDREGEPEGSEPATLSSSPPAVPPGTTTTSTKQRRGSKECRVCGKDKDPKARGPFCDGHWKLINSARKIKSGEITAKFWTGPPDWEAEVIVFFGLEFSYDRLKGFMEKWDKGIKSKKKAEEEEEAKEAEGGGGGENGGMPVPDAGGPSSATPDAETPDAEERIIERGDLDEAGHSCVHLISILKLVWAVLAAGYEGQPHVNSKPNVMEFFQNGEKEVLKDILDLIPRLHKTTDNIESIAIPMANMMLQETYSPEGWSKAGDEVDIEDFPGRDKLIDALAKAAAERKERTRAAN
jgi:hypothetical protein